MRKNRAFPRSNLEALVRNGRWESVGWGSGSQMSPPGPDKSRNEVDFCDKRLMRPCDDCATKYGGYGWWANRYKMHYGRHIASTEPNPCKGASFPCRNMSIEGRRRERNALLLLRSPLLAVKDAGYILSIPLSLFLGGFFYDLCVSRAFAFVLAVLSKSK